MLTKQFNTNTLKQRSIYHSQEHAVTIVKKGTANNLGRGKKPTLNSNKTELCNTTQVGQNTNVKEFHTFNMSKIE